MVDLKTTILFMHELMFLYSRCESKGMSKRSELIPYHYTNLTVVHECRTSGRSPEAIQPELKTNF